MRSVAILVLLCSAGVVYPGTNGILEGTITDKRTGESLPGVNVVLVGLNIGTTTGPDGYFVIPNIRAGSYDIRCTHIGYQSAVRRSVVVQPDLRTRLTFVLESTDVTLEEMVVTQEKPLIQRDITGTMYTVTGEDVQLLPIDNAVDAVRLKPGVTVEGNFRGGKTTEVLYLVDGLPVQDVLSGAPSATLPMSSITGMSIYTGGFEAEYGNALSGVVNIVSRTGTDDHRWFLRADKDNLFGGTQNSRTTDVELSASGPIVRESVHYLAAVSGFLTDTRWWQDFQHASPAGPVDRTMNVFGKLDYQSGPTLRLGVQVLVSDHEWHDYEFPWRFNLDGLPPERRTSNRIAAILSHSPSETFFYTASLNRFFVRSRIGAGEKSDMPVNDPYQYDFFLRYIVDGQRTWWSNAGQESYGMRFDGTFNVSRTQLLKFGGELTLYDLESDLVKQEPRLTYFGKPLVNEPQITFLSTYNYHPRSGSLYVQSKIDVPAEGVLLTFGLRYDFLDPRAERPQVEAIPLADTAYTFRVAGTTPASFKQQLSPRFGAAMQIAERGYLFVNLGWYFQYPLFDYLYTGLDRVALARGISAITGNPDLEPERTKVWELSLKYVLPFEIVASATYFRKESSNLVDTKTFIPGDSKLAGGFGFAEYVNNPYGEASGFELVVSRERGSWLTGELSYTFMVAEGLSGSSSDGFYIAQYGLPPGQRIYPLSWDQRHTVKAVALLTLPWDMGINTVFEWHTGRPYTAYPTSTGFEEIDGGVFLQNNARMPAYINLDVRAEQRFRFSWWSGAVMALYVDCRNLLNEQNVRWVDSNGREGGELGDPSAYYTGRRTSLGVRVVF